MKKYILLFSIFCLGLSNSFAQLGVGLRGGFGFSATSQELVTGMSRSLGSAPTFGLILNYDLDLHFSAGLEFNYTTFSETLKYDATIFPKTSDTYLVPSAVSITPKVSYLQIPIFGRVTFGDKKYKAVLSFGPYLGFGMKGSWNNGPKAYSNGPYVLFDSTYSSVKFKSGDFKRFDFGGQVGVGGQYQIGKSGVLFLEARLQLGFVDIYAKQTDKMRGAFTSIANGNGYIKPNGSWRTANITIGYYHTFKIPKKKASNAPAKKAGKQKK